MEPNFSELLEYIESYASSPNQGDEATPTCFYWPPGFLQDAIPEDEPITPDETEEADRRLEYFRVIDRQRRQIQELENSANTWKDVTMSTTLKFVRFKRRCHMALQGTTAAFLLLALALWHEAIATVGWNVLHGVAMFFGTGAEFLAGLLIAALLIRLMWELAKSVFRAAMEDLCPKPHNDEWPGDEEEDDFL